MELLRYARARDWAAVFGYVLFVGMMAVGYYYNITFVQLGLVDLGTRVVGMTEQGVAMAMAYLALLTTVIALASGVWMTKRGWSARFVAKLRLAFAVVVAQAVLTAVAPMIRTEGAFLAWIAAASVALGVAVPVTFGLTVDLVPVRDRGYAAGFITMGAYFVAAVFSWTWRIDAFAARMLPLMVPGALTVGVLVFRGGRLTERLGSQHARPEFGIGRFVSDSEGGRRFNPRLVVALVLMAGIFFVDSLGFLRIIATPEYVATAWQSPEAGPRLFIGATHVVAALAAAVLYSSLTEKSLFLWIFGIFSLVELEYVLSTLLPGESSSLAMPMLYAIAVSMYTVVNFAIWADLSTPRTISRTAALGVALAGLGPTFISTALSIQWRLGGIETGAHFSRVAAVALVFFIGVLALAYLEATERAEA